MKKSVIALALLSSLAHATVVPGEGEYHFGPETAESVACAIAEERAKENAIANFVGESIEHQTNQICRDTDCTTFKGYFSEVSGEVRRVIKKDSYVAPAKRASVCIVDIQADVVKVENQIDLRVVGKNELHNGDFFKIKITANRQGNVAVFSMSGENYKLVHETKIIKADYEKVLPPQGNFMAVLPPGKYQSQELLVFLFTDKDLTYEPFYTKMEFEKLVKELPFKSRKLVNHQINIMR